MSWKFVTLFILEILVAVEADEVCLQLSPSPELEKFVDVLPTPPKIYLSPRYRVTIGAYKITQKLHRDLPPTTLYAFGTSEYTASFPGPTLIAQKRETSFVRWENHIPDREHFLPVDYTILGAGPRYGYIPMVPHLHGQEGSSWSDGHPEAWFTSVGERGPGYVTQNYVYPNFQRHSLLWYHDHTYGMTRLNMAAGLVGVYVIESPWEDPSWVPRNYVLLVIQDKQFFSDGSINYPSVGSNPGVHPQWCPDYFGDTILVNGKVWPYIEVWPVVVRFRVLLAANSRFFILNLNDTSLSFMKIGTDGGYLATPIRQKKLRLSPSERVDILIDFRGVKPGERVLLYNTAPAPFPSGSVTEQEVLLFKVINWRTNGTIDEDDDEIPQALTPSELAELPTLSIIKATTGVDLSYVDWVSTYNRPFVHRVSLDSGNTLTGLFLQDRLSFTRPATEQVLLYTNEVWCMINTMTASHPIHIHLINFLVLEQQGFDTGRFAAGSCSFEYDYPDSRSCYTGEAQGADVDQVGWKDTAVIQPATVTRFFLAFKPSISYRFPLDPTTFPHFVWHCHILEHEDNEMMRPLVVSSTNALYTNKSFPRYFPRDESKNVGLATGNSIHPHDRKHVYVKLVTNESIHLY
ncbi:uncharacterized protein LOC112347409 [Selaginella moellendorffii]|uniref:uncharacterized protein LOC112347409 n=1 Tax=Selaginella moellendorffii TaxID=88036 RepID=UPI000D1C4222|nr:uncharacterized protein LOC112347409 [Selaginella moellendorffii]XP_024533943.1 uncharacterized protein LOC112347409 [Selaginella moellendorffii]XP_024533944.1 uncharacterized protein LOC112347409 [Selaginella moellendorffii]XP_024533945.1 uncharacterized protein LOC112347409 [Selaginella moellendorffii]XP_024533946.1 uncharacterized protein LOC112347409 [Selaginella moellendorffii]|eukprot:XP_024533942.1 uncharacterized protein LOC112347409 [Selaginella moellendorffii]